MLGLLIRIAMAWWMYLESLKDIGKGNYFWAGIGFLLGVLWSKLAANEALRLYEEANQGD